MKNDLVTSVVVAVIGVIASFVLCNILTGDMFVKNASVKSVSNDVNVSITEPNPEVFNYKAINPTVEVYVGNNNNCVQFDSDGNCIQSLNQQDEFEGTEPEEQVEQGND